MNDLDPFFTAAHQQQPDTGRMEFGLETRVLANIRQRRAALQSAPGIAKALWKILLPAFACCTIVAGLWWVNAWEDTDSMVFQMISPKSTLVEDWIF